MLRRSILFLFLFHNAWVGREKRVRNFPFFHKLADAAAFGLIADNGVFLRPFEQSVKVYFISSLDHDIMELMLLDGAPDGALMDAEDFSGFGHGQTDDFGGGHTLNYEL